MSPDLAHYLTGIRRCYEKAHERLSAQDFEAFLIEVNLIRCNFERLAEPLPPLSEAKAREMLDKLRARQGKPPKRNFVAIDDGPLAPFPDRKLCECTLWARDFAKEQGLGHSRCEKCHGLGLKPPADAVTIMTSGGQVEVVRAGDAPTF